MVKEWFDKWGDRLHILVAGSARLDHYRHGGDSPQGRYHFLRLHPLSVAELNLSTSQKVKELLAFGGFPEPYLLKDEIETKRWSREYRTRVVKGDVHDLERVMDMGSSNGFPCAFQEKRRLSPKFKSNSVYAAFPGFFGNNLSLTSGISFINSRSNITGSGGRLFPISQPWSVRTLT
jgi:hypothetical protein